MPGVRGDPGWDRPSVRTLSLDEAAMSRTGAADDARRFE
jgi:hypothetical protein